MEDSQKRALFNVWNTLGISTKNAKYIGVSFESQSEFLSLLQEFLGITPVEVGSNRAIFDNLEDYIVKDVNQYIISNPSLYPSLCGEYKVRLFKINLSKDMTSPHFLNISPFYIVNAEFFYSMNLDFECPTPPDVEDDSACFDDTCIYPVVSQVGRYILNKYGFKVFYDVDYQNSNSPLWKLIRE
jgi:hypothetical protein